MDIHVTPDTVEVSAKTDKVTLKVAVEPGPSHGNEMFWAAQGKLASLPASLTKLVLTNKQADISVPIVVDAKGGPLVLTFVEKDASGMIVEAIDMIIVQVKQMRTMKDKFEQAKAWFASKWWIPAAAILYLFMVEATDRRWYAPWSRHGGETVQQAVAAVDKTKKVDEKPTYTTVKYVAFFVHGSWGRQVNPFMTDYKIPHYLVAPNEDGKMTPYAVPKSAVKTWDSKKEGEQVALPSNYRTWDLANPAVEATVMNNGPSATGTRKFDLPFDGKMKHYVGRMFVTTQSTLK